MDQRPQLSDRAYRHIYDRVPRLCVDLMVRRGASVLLTRRRISPFRGYWHLPGGGLRHRERVRDAVRRVARAELGQAVRDITFVGIMETLRCGRRGHAVSLVFRVVPASDRFTCDEQATAARFFPRLPRRTIPSHREFLRRV